MSKRTILSLIFIVLGILILIILDWPLWKKITLLRNDVILQERTLALNREIFNKTQNLTGRFDAIGEKARKISFLLPKEKDLANLTVQLEDIGFRNNIVLQNLNISEAAPEPGRDFVKIRAEVIRPSILNMDMILVGDYSSFINFLKDLELNIRLVDPTLISFTSTVLPGVRDQSRFTINLKAKTYYLP